MTEQTVPFGSTAVADPPAPILPVDSDDSGDADNRRKLLLVGGIVGVLVLVIAAFFLLKGGSSSNSTFTVPHHNHPATANNAGTTASKPVVLPKHYNGKIGRDPFKALYVAPAAGAAAAGGATSTTTTPSGTTSGTGTAAAPTFNPVWLQLVSVNGTSSATFVVGYSNGSSLKTQRFSNVLAPTSSTRTTFASVFALLSIHGGKATVQFGDGTPIDIAPGAANRLVVS
jgi:hypothetical protein